MKLKLKLVVNIVSVQNLHAVTIKRRKGPLLSADFITAGTKPGVTELGLGWHMGSCDFVALHF